MAALAVAIVVFVMAALAAIATRTLANLRLSHLRVAFQNIAP